MRYNAENGHIDFPHALEVLIAGRKVRRIKWPEGVYVALIQDGFFAHMPTRNKDVDWLPSADELMATDWLEVTE